jgi:hypothetical protein
MYEQFFKDKMSEDEFIRLNAEACKKLQLNLEKVKKTLDKRLPYTILYKD